MVSCGLCSRWQHIPCHDRADQNAGLPRRNWEVQQFYCSRCKPAAMQRLTSHGSRSSTAEHRSRSQPLAQKPHPQVAQYDAYPQSTSDVRYSQQQTQYTNGVSYGQQNQHDQPGGSSGSLYGQSPRPQGGITFSHYQPQQHGFSRTTWSNGYSSTDAFNGRSISQYNQSYHQNGSYSGVQHPYQV